MRRGGRYTEHHRSRYTTNYKLTVVKAETNSVKVSGAGKNYTGWTTVTATK